MTFGILHRPATRWSRRSPWLAGAALAVLAAPTATHAQSVWNGTNSTNWFDAGNWTPNAVPNNAIDATIDTVAPNPTVASAGAASAQSVFVGNAAGTTGRLTVTGGSLTVGGAASGGTVIGGNGSGTLNIQGGAFVDPTGLMHIGRFAGSTGTVTVDGAGSRLSNVNLALRVGEAGGAGALVVQNGGAVTSFRGSVGANSSATLTGAGSLWNNSFSLGIEGTLRILNGAELSNNGRMDVGTIGSATVIVDGAGSKLTKGGGVIFVSNNSTLTISNGGVFAGVASFIGGTSSQATVTGTGSRWTNTNYLNVQSGTLSILNGGFVSSIGNFGNNASTIGEGYGAVAQATIDGAGSRWASGGNLIIGYTSGASGTMTLRNGGTAGAYSVQIGQDAGSVGTLNIGAAFGAAAVAPGTLDTPTVAFGAGSGRIVFNHTSSSYTFAPVVSGAGTLLFEAGTTNLTGNSTTFTGDVIVNGGTLLANGWTAFSTTTVNAGGTLGGTGLIGNTTINGGTLSPGNSIGTLSVQGNLVFTAAATYLVEVDPNGADRTNVNGTATLGGATVHAVYASGSYVTRRYNILSAGGVSGTFSSLVNTNLPASFAATLNYDTANVYLDIALAPGAGQSLNGNQRSVANALANSFNAVGGIPLVFGALTAQGLTQVSGEAATGTQQTTFNAMDQFVGMMTDPFLGARAGGAPQAGANGYADEDETLAYAAKKQRSGAGREAYAAFKAPPRAPAFERRWSVWGSGYGGTQKTDGNSATGSNDVTSRIYGGAAGFDYRLSPDTLVGFALGGAGTNYSLALGLGGGRSEMFQAGVYGRHTFGAAYLAGALAYGWQDVTTDRNVFGNVYRANFDASSFAGRLEGGYRFAFGASGLSPYAAGQVTSFFLPAYAEGVAAGVNTFALSYADKDVTASRTELGLRGDTSFVMQDAIVTLRGRAAWAHNFNTARSVGVIFQTLPASAFVVNGAAQARDSALTSAGIEVRWLNGFSVAATFEGEFSNVTDSYAGKGTVRYQW